MSNWQRSFAELQEGVRLALYAVRSNKFRSLMTIVGVMIGVGAVILVNTIMDGFTGYANESIDKIGTNVMYITKWDNNTDFDNLTDEQRRRPNIRMVEALAVQEMCPLVQAVSPQKKSWDNIAKYGSRQIRSPDDFRGSWPEDAIVTNREVDYGRFIDENDLRRGAMVCVIGPDIADALFDERASSIGEVITVNGSGHPNELPFHYTRTIVKRSLYILSLLGITRSILRDG